MLFKLGENPLAKIDEHEFTYWPRFVFVREESCVYCTSVISKAVIRASSKEGREGAVFIIAILGPCLLSRGHETGEPVRRQGLIIHWKELGHPHEAGGDQGVEGYKPFANPPCGTAIQQATFSGQTRKGSLARHHPPRRLRNPLVGAAAARAARCTNTHTQNRGPQRGRRIAISSGSVSSST